MGTIMTQVGGGCGRWGTVEMIIVDVWSKESKEDGDHHVF